MLGYSSEERRHTDFESMKREEIKKFKKRVGRNHEVKNGKVLRSMNVAVFGTCGVGKSSFINTVMTSLSDGWTEWTSEANYAGLGHQGTYHFMSINKEAYLGNEENIAYNYPTLIDIAGFENVDNGINREILRMILYGRLPENERLTDVRQCLQHGDDQLLKDKYCITDENLKVGFSAQ